MPITISGDGGIAGVTNLDGGDFECATLVASGDTTLGPQAVGRASLFVDDSANSVGINTTTPAAAVFLEVADGTDPIVSLNNTGNGEVRLGCTSTAGYIGTESNHPFNIETNSTIKAVVLANGNIGVGNTSPTELIELRGGLDQSNVFLTTNSTAANSGSTIAFQSTTNGWGLNGAHASIKGGRVDGSNGYLDFSTRQGGSTGFVMRLDQNGYVGIGSTSPQRPLVVSDNSTAGFEFYPGSITNTQNTLNHYNRSTSSFINSLINADQHIFGRADGEKIRIDQSGRLLINTATSVGYNNYLQVIGDDADKSAATFWRSSNNNGNPSITFVKTRGTVALPTAVVNNDVVGHLRFNGHDGSVDDSRTAQIVAKVDGTPGTSVPGRICFETSPSTGSATSLQERFRINSRGQTYNVETFSASDISAGKTLDELPYLGNTKKRLYNYSTNKVAAIGNFEAVFRISFNGGSNDTSHFRISANTRNAISTGGNIGYTYCDFTFSSGNGTTPFLETHETVVDARSYNSGFCEPIQDGNDVWIFIRSNSSSSSARLDIDSIQLEVTTASPSSFTLYSATGSPTANGVSNPEVITGHTFHNNIAIDGAVQNFIRAGNVSFGGGSTTGEFTITVEGLRTLNGSAWYKAGLFVGFTGVRQNLSNDQIALYYFGIRGLSLWNSLQSNSLLNSITASITSSTSNSFTMTFTPASTSTYGSVFAIAQGNGASPQIIIAG